MASDADSLQIAAIFEIFFVSLLGCCIPFMYAYMNVSHDPLKPHNKDMDIYDNIINNSTFRIGRGFSTGIIIGVAVMHLLAEVADVDLLGNGYPSKYI